jgi:hypothetical protein
MSNLLDMKNLPPTLEISELAGLMRKGVRTLQRYIKEGRLDELPPGRKIGNKWVWGRDASLLWLSPPPATPAPLSLGQLAENLIQANEVKKK